MRRTRTYGGSRGRPADTSFSPSWYHTSWPSAQSWHSGRSGIELTRNIIFRENKHFKIYIFRQYTSIYVCCKNESFAFLKGILANEKGEASGAVLNIICCMVREAGAGCFFLLFFILIGCSLV
jgi:hypothetical protein